MKNRVKVLASAFLLLGILSLSTETSRADDPGDVICFNVYNGTLFGGSKIWRCTPNGCVEKRAKEWSVQSLCPPVIQ